MIDTDTIEKYILGGEWENQYPQVIEQLLTEVKRLRKYNYKLKRFVENIEWGLNEINDEYKEIKEVIE